MQQLENGNRPQEIAQAQAQLSKAQADLRAAQDDLQRNQSLYSAGAIAQQTVVQKQSVSLLPRLSLDSFYPRALA